MYIALIYDTNVYTIILLNHKKEMNAPNGIGCPQSGMQGTQNGEKSFLMIPHRHNVHALVGKTIV